MGLADADRSLWVHMSNEELFLIIDNLAELHGAVTKTKLGEIETEAGFPHQPLGLMADMSLRPTYRPTQHHLID